MTSSKVPPPADPPHPPKLVALVYDPRGDQHHRRVRFIPLGGTTRKPLLIRNRTFAEGDRAVVRLLADAGFPAPAGTADQRLLVKGIEVQSTSRRLLLADQVGWVLTPAGPVFVLPDEVIGKARSAVHVELRDGYPKAKFARTGSLDGWLAEVAALATGNHVLVFVLALAFAPPLLRLLGEERGGFLLVAGTRGGKSTALEAHASVWGLAFAETWRTTVNAVERTAADHNDLPLPLDEPALLGNNPRDRANKLYEAVHALAGGRGKERLTDAGRPWEWLDLFLSASEKTFRQLIEEGGREVVGGELERLVDVRLCKKRGKGIYQDLCGYPTVREFCVALKKAIARCHGTAGRAYLRRLVREVEDDKDGLVAWLRKRIEAYSRRARLAGRGPEAESVTARFALVYAAGCLAAEYEVLPWSRKEILAAVRHCHRRACADADASAGTATTPMSKPRVSQEQLVRAVAGSIVRLHPGLVDPRRKPSVAEVKAAPGFVHRGKNGTELLFRPAVFREVVCAGLDERAVIAALKAEGLLVTHAGGKSSVVRELPEPLGRTRVMAVKADIERFGSGATAC